MCSSEPSRRTRRARRCGSRSPELRRRLPIPSRKSHACTGSSLIMVAHWLQRPGSMPTGLRISRRRSEPRPSACAGLNPAEDRPGMRSPFSAAMSPGLASAIPTRMEGLAGAAGGHADEAAPVGSVLAASSDASGGPPGDPARSHHRLHLQVVVVAMATLAIGWSRKRSPCRGDPWPPRPSSPSSSGAAGTSMPIHAGAEGGDQGGESGQAVGVTGKRALIGASSISATSWRC